MAMKPTTPKPDGPVQKYIGTAYDVVKEVYDNLDFLRDFNADVGSAVDDARGYRDEAFQFKEDAVAASVAAALAETNVNSKYTTIQAIETDLSAKHAAVIAAETNVTNLEASANTSASNASTSEANASASEDKAEKWATELEDVEVETGKYSANHHRIKASEHDSSAQASASNASTSESNAATSASNAATSEANAATSETNAANSEASALTYKNSASTDAGIATTKAFEALTSASNAATSESNANISETNALAHKDKAELWAEAPHNVEVEPGKYSSLHWAVEAALSAVGAIKYKGSWDASTGTYPANPETGFYYKVAVAGTVNSTEYKINDAIIYNGTDWDKIDNTETVVSVAGKTGTIELGILDIIGLQAALDGKLSITAAAADANRLNNELPAFYLNWDNFTNKPTAFPPANHTHDASEIVTGTMDYGRLPISATQVTNWDTAYGWGDWSAGVDKAFVDALGINADTLNGLSNSQFVRSDASDSLSGIYTFYTNSSSAPLRLRDSADNGDTAMAWMQFQQADGGQLGYVGFPVTTNSDLYLFSNSDSIRLFSGGTEKFQTNATGTKTWGTHSVSEDLSIGGSILSGGFTDFNSDTFRGGFNYSGFQPANTPDGLGSNYYTIFSAMRSNKVYDTQLILNANSGTLTSRSSFDSGSSWTSPVQYIDDVNSQVVGGSKTFSDDVNIDAAIKFENNYGSIKMVDGFSDGANAKDDLKFEAWGGIIFNADSNNNGMMGSWQPDDAFTWFYGTQQILTLANNGDLSVTGNISFDANGQWFEFNKDATTRDNIYWNSNGVTEWKLFHDSNNDLRLQSIVNHGTAAFVVDGATRVTDQTEWYVSASNAAHQRCDARSEDTTESRLHWYGRDSSLGLSNFRHAWYTGSDYIDVTAFENAGSSTVKMNGDILIQKANSWLTLDSGNSGPSGTTQGAGISLGEAGYKAGAALHLTYIGTGYSYIGMGVVDATTNIPQYRAMRFHYQSDDVTFYGDPTFNSSDMRLKTAWRPKQNATESLMKIEVGYFDWDKEACRKAGHNPNRDSDFGFSAQSLQAAGEDLVSTITFTEDEDATEYLTPRDRQTLALAVATIQEQQREIEYLKSQLSEVLKRV